MSSGNCFQRQRHLDGNRSDPAAGSSWGGAEGGSEKDSNEVPKPKRPLSGYNIFFQHERQNILDQTPTRQEGKPRRSHGKIGFAELGKNNRAPLGMSCDRLKLNTCSFHHYSSEHCRKMEGRQQGRQGCL